MANKTLLLLKAAATNSLKLGDVKAGDKKVRNRAIGMAFVYGFLSLYLLGYCIAMYIVMGKYGFVDLIPMISILIGTMLTLVLMMVSSAEYIFGGRDYEMLLSLPVKVSSIVKARFLKVYLVDSIFNVLILLPAFIIYTIYGSFHFIGLLTWISGLVFCSMVPSVVGILLGSIILAIASRFRHSKAVYAVLTMALMVVVFVGSFSMGFESESMSMEALLNIIASVGEKIGGLYPPAAWFCAGVCGQVSGFLAYLLLALAAYAVFMFVSIKGFRFLHRALIGHVASVRFKMTDIRTSSPLKALYLKEWKRFTGCSVYFTNVAAGLVLSLLFSVVFAVYGVDRILALTNSPDIPLDRFVVAVPFFVAMFLALSSTTTCAFSLEGKALWIVQTLPVLPKQLFDSKILVGLTLTIPVAVVNSICLCIAMHPGWVGVIYIVLILATAVFTAIFGMFVNLHIYNLDWETEVTPVKQGVSVLVGGVVPMFTLMGMGGLSMALPEYVNYIMLGASILLILLSLFFYYKVAHSSIPER